jgi:hypothetical protein
MIREIIEPSSGKIKMYHTFGKSRSYKIVNGKSVADVMPKEELVNRVKQIMQNGFIPGDDHIFGKGLYAFKLEVFQSLSSESNQYGSYALEFEIKDVSRWLIFDIQEAKKVKGSNYTLRAQCESMGVNLNAPFTKYRYYEQDEESKEWVSKSRFMNIGDFMDQIDEWERTDEIGDNDDYVELMQKFAHHCPDYNIDGILLNEVRLPERSVLGFFVCYNLESVVLTGYSDDVGSGIIKSLPSIEMK